MQPDTLKYYMLVFIILGSVYTVTGLISNRARGELGKRARRRRMTGYVLITIGLVIAMLYSHELFDQHAEPVKEQAGVTFCSLNSQNRKNGAFTGKTTNMPRGNAYRYKAKPRKDSLFAGVEKFRAKFNAYCRAKKLVYYMAKLEPMEDNANNYEYNMRGALIWLETNGNNAVTLISLQAGPGDETAYETAMAILPAIVKSIDPEISNMSLKQVLGFFKDNPVSSNSRFNDYSLHGIKYLSEKNMQYDAFMFSGSLEK
ncbi:MAG: hypothetical protein V4543_03235 [Bacteroidota bacterium]